jgi:hypothetical protein
MMKDATAHPGATGLVAFRTTCGRDLRVGPLALGTAEQPSWRVSSWSQHWPPASPFTRAGTWRGTAWAATGCV